MATSQSRIESGPEDDAVRGAMDRSQKTILVVDDDERIRTALHSGLTLSGYQAVTQSNGREGLAWLDEHRPNLIILDVVIPEVDGLRFIGELRRRGLHPGVRSW